MECCGNTIKDLYGFSCPLKCSTYILQSALNKQEVIFLYWLLFLHNKEEVHYEKN